MKINSINIQNFLGAKSVQAQLETTVTLFAGKNHAGKSSIRDAVAMALTANLGRVSQKKDAGELLTTDAKKATVSVDTNLGEYSVAITKGGSITDSQAGTKTPAALQHVIDAQQFANMSETDRRVFLFGLMNVKTSGSATKERLVAKGCEPGKIDQILPVLKSGFAEANKESEAKARDSKAAWKTVTGETWSESKAKAWEPEPLPEIADKAISLHDNAVKKSEEITLEISRLTEALGNAKAIAQQNTAIASQRAALQDEVDKAPRIKAKLEHDTAELESWRAKVAATKLAAEGEEDHDGTECPCCHALLQVVNSAYGPIVLREYNPPDRVPNPDAVRRLPAELKSLELFETAVKNDQRDLENAQIATARIADLKEVEQTISIEAIQDELNRIKPALQGWKDDAEKYRLMAIKKTQRQGVIDSARRHHVDVMQWTAIAKALAPDGIPAELLSEALAPINARLLDSSISSEWHRVVITDDMSITYGGRSYRLCSESEKWRIDAMIAEAISHISGLKLLVLDRVDMLDPQKGRADLMFWLDDLAANNELDTALLFGTLKALPTQLPESIKAIWIEDGIINQPTETKEAA